MRSPEVSRGFKPIAGGNARVLVLGTLPGGVSLAKREYYAQKRNQFWPIVAAIFEFSPALSYKQRATKLKEAGIALWDVCASAERRGSLDSAIRSARSNAFETFFKAHRNIELICFNGKKAEKLYRRIVLAGLAGRAQKIPYKALPSTSPAYAAMRFKKKLRVWRKVLTSLNLLQ